MRKILLKAREKMGDKEMLSTVLNHTPEGRGFSLDEIRKTIAVLDKLERAEAFLLLEEAEWAMVKTKVVNFHYGIASPAILEMADAVEKAEEIELKDVPSG